MAEHPFAVLKAAAIRAGVAVNAQDRRRHFGAFLLHHKAECLLALGGWCLQRNDPVARDGRPAGQGGLVHMARGLERVFARRPTARRRRRAAELAVIQRGIDGGEVMLDVEGELAVLKVGAGGAVIGPETIIESAFEALAFPGNIQAERNVDPVVRDHRIPAAVNGGGIGLRDGCPAAGGEKRGKTGGFQKRLHWQLLFTNGSRSRRSDAPSSAADRRGRCRFGSAR